MSVRGRGGSRPTGSQSARRLPRLGEDSEKQDKNVGTFKHKFFIK